MEGECVIMVGEVGEVGGNALFQRLTWFKYVLSVCRVTFGARSLMCSAFLVHPGLCEALATCVLGTREVIPAVKWPKMIGWCAGTFDVLDVNLGAAGEPTLELRKAWAQIVQEVAPGA